MGSTIRPRCIPPATTARIVAAPNKTHPLRALGIFTIGILHLCVRAGAPVLLPFQHQKKTRGRGDQLKAMSKRRRLSPPGYEENQRKLALSVRSSTIHMALPSMRQAQPVNGGLTSSAA